MKLAVEFGSQKHGAGLFKKKKQKNKTLRPFFAAKLQLRFSRLEE